GRRPRSPSSWTSGTPSRPGPTCGTSRYAEPNPSPLEPSMMEDVPSFTSYWTNARARTTRVLDLLPESELEWSHAAGRFTFGDLLRHLAGIERFMYAENVSGRPSRYPGHSASLAAGIPG